VTADTALLLAKAFGTSPDLWLSLQNDFDVQVAKQQIGRALDKIAPVITVAPQEAKLEDDEALFFAARAGAFLTLN
jgi:plasmid maintenance system antidote protein VapI